MASHSPSSSPRLPSPPPMAEDQIGPTSPGVMPDDNNQFPNVNSIDNGASRRTRRGTKAEDIAEGPPLTAVQDIDSAFQLTEHLKALHYSHTHPDNSDTIQPITADVARQLATPPANSNSSRDIWLYELGRFLIQKTNAIIVALFQDSPPCSPTTCPEMRASEWQYLCAVHDPPKSCAAIDYCCHTLDWAATTLTSSKMFPSRLGLGSGGTAAGTDKVLQQQIKEIRNIFRRVYRIYAHAWFQHREMFWRVESKTGLYVFFKTVCDEYGIIESENYTIPAEAEGLEPGEEAPARTTREPNATGLGLSSSPTKKGVEQEMGLGGDTTKRHRHTMSDFSSGVTAVIQEEVEEEETGQREEEPVPGVTRSDTIKPILQDGDEEEEEGEQTVLDTSNVEAMSPEPEPQQQEQPAAEGEAAGKSVQD